MKLRHTTLHGHDVRYLIEGRGPVVLLIHGMAGSSRTWAPVVHRLAGRHTVIAPDLLGHGGSAKPSADYSLGNHASHLRDLLATLGVESATVVGQSLGGGIAMQLAYQHPEIAERLVLVGSGGLGREVSWLLRALALPGSELAMEFLFPRFVVDWGDRLSLFLKDRGIRAPHAVEIWRAYRSLVAPESRRAFLRTLRAVVDPGGQAVSATDRLYLAASIPTLIVWGDRDDIIPVEHAYQTHDSIPESRLEIFEGAGHFLHAEEPERFAALLEDFIRTTEPGPVDRESYRRLIAAGGERA